MAQPYSQVYKAWRTQARKTQKQVEKATGIQQTYISAFEVGRLGEPGAEKLARLVWAIGRSVDDFMKECLGDDQVKVARLQPAA